MSGKLAWPSFGAHAAGRHLPERYAFGPGARWAVPSAASKRADELPHVLDHGLARPSLGRGDAPHDGRADDQSVGHRRQQPHMLRPADAETDADRQRRSARGASATFSIRSGGNSVRSPVMPVTET